jgi:predicted phage terminase large subunit-like protein
MIDVERARRSLVEFIQMVWPILEPARKFIRGWVVDAICEHLEAVTRGEIKKLLINVPPGCMKSLTTNVFWPAWEWGPAGLPSMRYISASYSERLTMRDNRRCRNVITSEIYQRHWGDKFSLMGDQNAKLHYANDATGFKLATSVGGLATGERGDRFVIDDPHNVTESESELKRETALQWFTEVVPTRLNDADKSATVIIMQRVHERDISGLILSEGLGFDHLCLPMEYEDDHPFMSKTRVNFVDPRTTDGEFLWPQRFSPNYLDNELKPTLRSWGGEYAVAGQLQQRPSPRGGGMFKRDDFGVVAQTPTGEVVRRVRGWDLAATAKGGKFTAGVLLARTRTGRIFVEDVVRGQWSDLEVEMQIKAAAMRDGKRTCQSLPQDPGQAGKAQKSALARLLEGFDVHFSLESGDKEHRARPIAAQTEAGNVSLLNCGWNEKFLGEVETFPRGAYSDQVDALSRAYARLLAMPNSPLPVAPVLIGAG